MDRIRQTRRRLATDGPPWTRSHENDFANVTLPAQDCDALRDLLIAEGVTTVVEIGLAYGSSALAIGEALAAVGAFNHRLVVIDPFQEEAWHNVGWDQLRLAGIDQVTRLMRTPSSLALAHLVTEGLVADAAFVDGSHRFHEVFVDLYFLRKIVRPGGLVLLDDYSAPSVRTAVRYYEHNLRWTVIPGAFAGGTVTPVVNAPADQPVTRCVALRLPRDVNEPAFEAFQPF